MDFARKQLEKYGWTDGKGLGKNENGISQALKPKLKRSVTGIGHDAAAEFTEHWWTKLYNTAASNVEVKEKNGKTKAIKTRDDEFEITNNSWSYKKTNKNKSKEEYTNFFVKSAILSNGGAKTEDLNEDNEEKEIAHEVKLTDEELFAACEGRTAHKGARHGLKALGKLARIEMQEQALLQQTKYNGYSRAKKNKINSNEDTNVASGSDKKAKKKKQCCLLESDIPLSNGPGLANTEPVKKVKNKIKENNSDTSSENGEDRLFKLNNQVDENIGKEDKDEETVSTKRKKKKKRKKSTDVIVEEDNQNEDIMELASKKRKNKKSKNTEQI